MWSHNLDRAYHQAVSPRMTDKFEKLTRLYSADAFWTNGHFLAYPTSSTVASEYNGQHYDFEFTQGRSWWNQLETRWRVPIRVRLIRSRHCPDVRAGCGRKGDFFDPEEYLGSFSALRDSMAQGRDLKKKRKALDEYKKTLDTLRKAYEDRVNIARNYDAMITDQGAHHRGDEHGLSSARRAREDVERKIADANEELAELKRRQARERKPLEEELDSETRSSSPSRTSSSR